MLNFTDLASVSSHPVAPFTDRLRLTVAAYLARFKGRAREHTAQRIVGRRPRATGAGPARIYDLPVPRYVLSETIGCCRAVNRCADTR